MYFNCSKIALLTFILILPKTLVQTQKNSLYNFFSIFAALIIVMQTSVIRVFRHSGASNKLIVIMLLKPEEYFSETKLNLDLRLTLSRSLDLKL